jgi:Flp pilus assembly CpaF family ATPase
MDKPMIYSPNPEIETAITTLYAAVTPYLTDPTVQEVSANWDPVTKISRLYADYGAGPMQLIGTVEPNSIVAVTLMLATGAGKSLNADAPFLNCVLPCGARYHAALPPVADGASFSIRTHHPRQWSLGDFMSAEQATEITKAVLERLTIMVAGGTFTGKTSLLNATINLIPEDERLLVIEDEPELRIRDGNVTRRQCHAAACHRGRRPKAAGVRGATRPPRPHNRRRGQVRRGGRHARSAGYRPRRWPHYHPRQRDRGGHHPPNAACRL